MTHPASIFEGVRGETAALAAAFLWAMATILFGRAGKKIPPIELNLVKGVVAIVFIVLTLLIAGDLLTAIDPRALLLLSLSGILGIGIGDTAYFDALNRLGDRRTLLMLMLSPPMAGLVAWVALGETLAMAAWAGVFLTVLGVGWVVTERYAGADKNRGVLKRGLMMGTVAALAQAVGVVFARAAMTQTTITPLWAALLRLSAGVVMLFVWIVCCPPESWRFERSRYKSLWRLVIFATFIGTYLAIWLQQISLRLTSAGIAQTLLSTSPLFVLPLAVWMGDKVSLRAVAGVLVALLGIALLFGLIP